MIRHVRADLYQVGESLPGLQGHEAMNVYVLLNNGCPLIFDTGSHVHQGTILTELKELLGEIEAGYVFLTHTELPHTGNLRAILTEWPQIKVVISEVILPYSEMPLYVSADQIQNAVVGATHTYGGREICSLDALLKDQPATYWLYDAQTGTLFCGDGFGYVHPAEAAHKFDDELKGGIPVEWFRQYHQKAFAFLPHVYADRLNADLDRIFANRTIRALAPTHGSALRGDIPLHVIRIKDALSALCTGQFLPLEA